MEYPARKYLICDTETSGLFDFAKGADAEGQPRLAHFVGIKIDEEAKTRSVMDLYVKPDGWTLEGTQAQEINKLSMERLEAEGLPIADVLRVYANILDEGHIFVSFNSRYDSKVMRGELRRAGMDDRFEQTHTICVMLPLQGLGITKASGKSGWPTLADACRHFHINLDEAHQGLADALGAEQIFHQLRGMGRLPEPRIPYAKRRPEIQNTMDI